MSSSNSNSIAWPNRPVGGIVLAIFCVIYALAMPVGAFRMAMRGNLLQGVLLVVLAVPLFIWMANEAWQFNEDIHEFRERLRRDHIVLFYTGVGIRLSAVALLILAVFLDITVFARPPIPNVLFASVAGIFLAVISVFVSWVVSTFL